MRVANEIFTPDKDEYAYALRVLAAYDEAVAAGRGAVTFDGRMIDEATRKMAQNLAARGRTAGIG